jgi:cytochrome c
MLAIAIGGAATGMDGFEFNKIAGAVLSAMLVIAAGRTLLEIATARHAEGKPGWELPVHEATKEAAVAPAVFNPKDVLALLPKASAENGADTFKKCQTCHTSTKGAGALVGPNLWGIVGRKVASFPGFESRYSDAMKAHGGEWTLERLAKYLHHPAAEVPGNKMLFAGVEDNQDLADLLEFLRTKLADNPAPLPK